MKPSKARTFAAATVAFFACMGMQSQAGTLIALWDFENNYNDSVSSHDLTERGSVPFVASISGVGVAFDGGIAIAPSPIPIDALDLAGISAPDPANFNAQGMSLMGWLRHSQSAQGNGPNSSGTIIAQSGWAIAERGWALNMTSDGFLNLSLRDSTDQRNVANTTISIPEDEWTHIAVTWDGSSADGFTFYVNGNIVGHTSLQVGAFGGFPNGPIQMTLGATPLGAPGGVTEHGFIGELDHVSVWLGVLTPAEVEADYNINLDGDGDGVLDDIDLCPNTPIGAIVDAFGCSIEQLVPCDGPISGGEWKNHGQYVSTLAKTTAAWVNAGLISQAERNELISEASNSDCGRN